MSVADNKSRIEHFVKFFCKATLDQYLELYAPNVVLHGYPPDLPPGWSAPERSTPASRTRSLIRRSQLT